MSIAISRAHSVRLLAAAAALAVVAGGVAVLTSSSASAADQRVRTCVNKKTGALRVIPTTKKCKKKERFVLINVTGKRGARGAQGVRGLQGVQGIQGVRGVQGEKGDKGDQGAAGYGVIIRGTSDWPTISAIASPTVGDLWVLSAANGGAPTRQGGGAAQAGDGILWTAASTWVDVGAIRGPQGLVGDKGDKGDTGAQGVKGDKGDTGSTGATGATGPSGAAGATGATGATGPMQTFLSANVSNVSSQQSNRYIGLGYNSGVNSTVANVTSPVPTAGNLSGFRVLASSASNTLAVTVYKNGVATGVKCTVASAGTTCTSATTVAFAAGDTVAYKLTNSGSRSYVRVVAVFGP